MDERVIKQWRVAGELLSDAANELSADPLDDLESYLAHNELGLAFDVLLAEAAEREPPPSSSFWRLMKQAADVMGLTEHRNNLRNQFRTALARESISAPRT